MINYYLLTKPGIVMGNLVTFAAGFLLAAKGVIDFGLFLATLIGLALIMASACVFNNYIDRKIDKKMSRTKDRALVTGLISSRHAILFAIGLAIVGNIILLEYTNLLTVGITSVGFFVYVVLYSLWKCHTIYGTAIGSIAGAVPPVVGYCAVSNNFDMGALILFTMMVLWQMPHFFAIAMYHYDDYVAAGVPVLPIKKGALRAKIHMVLYVIGFVAAAMMLTLFNYTGFVYLAVVAVLGIAWLRLTIQGFKSHDDKLWGFHMFRLSLVMIGAVCIVIPFDII
ncbi:MAG: heme o synthase [Chlamydiales bacterium]|nr:heme o synthase [Chlamydiales bacterium]